MATAKPLGHAKAGARVNERKAGAQRALQPKLEVGPAQDHHEREADRVARQVTRGGNGPVAIPPTITPLGAQRKKLQSPRAPDEKANGKAGASAQRKPAGKGGAKPDEPNKSAKAQRKPTGKAEDPKKGAKTARAQRKEAAGPAGATGTGSTAPDHVESAVSRMQADSSQRLDGGTRGFMEGRFGRDFSQVRIHRGSNAAQAATAIDARAFTVGNDIFFNRGQYNPHSQSGRELLAHELTHTVQQSGPAQARAARRVAQRASPTTAPAAPAKAQTGDTPKAEDVPTEFASKKLDKASINLTPVKGPNAMLPGTITLPRLVLPKAGLVAKGTGGDADNLPAKADGGAVPQIGASYTLDPVPARDSKVAAETWTAKAAPLHQAKAKAKLQDRVTKASSAKKVEDQPVRAHLGGDAYFFKLAGSMDKSGPVLFGTIDSLATSDAITRPQWTRGSQNKAVKHAFDVDHNLELQLGGLDGYDNMWLLDSAFNQKVGGDIDRQINQQLDIVIDEIAAAKAIPDARKPGKARDARRTWRIVFSEVAEDAKSNVEYYWKRKHLADGAHIDLLDPMTEADMTTFGLKLDGKTVPAQVHIFPTENGGTRRTLALNSKGDVQVRNPGDGEFLFKGVFVTGGTYHADNAKSGSGPMMTLCVNVMKTDSKAKSKADRKQIIERREGSIDVAAIPGLNISGVLTRSTFNKDFKLLNVIPMCPLVLSDIGVNADGVLSGMGVVTSELDLLPGLKVPMSIHGDRVGLDFPIPDKGMAMGPFEVSQCALALTASEAGFGVEGSAHMSVRGLGEGDITGTVNGDDVMLTGTFALATDFLNPGIITIGYNVTRDELSASATLGLAKDKCPPGIVSANGVFNATKEGLDFSASLGLAAPLTGAEVQVSYGKEKGLHIGAENIPLPLSKVPAVKDATMSVDADRDPQSGAWRFSGAGHALLAVPGATGAIEVSYLDGLITVHGTGQIEKGPASGTLDVSITNGTLDANGAVSGPPTDRITPWGKGSVTVKFGKVLSGTAGITLTPDSRVILAGEIAMPPVYEVFPRKDYKKDLLRIAPPEFPIWGVSVAGVGVGVFAFVDARLAFNAFVGPGQIRDAKISATMDLDKPEDATVHGHGEFFVPAFAGLSLDVGGGLRARVAVAYAEGRVGLTGELGIAADASAGLDVDWSRASGLAIETKLAAHARPKFSLFANASVTVGVDLLVTDVSETFGPWSKKLGEFGPDLELGVEMPVRWSEAKGLDLDIDQITVTKPSFDAPALMSGVFDALTG
jgi:hypothetical protein